MQRFRTGEPVQITFESVRKAAGISQAETYIRGLTADLDLLVQHPGIARERVEICPPVRLYRSESHLIIYRIEAVWLDMLCIVHARQNWAAYLNE